MYNVYCIMSSSRVHEVSPSLSLTLFLSQNKASMKLTNLCLFIGFGEKHYRNIFKIFLSSAVTDNNILKKFR